MTPTTNRHPRPTWVALAIAAAALGATLLSLPSAEAVSTRSFLLDSDKALSAGEMDGTAVHSDGSVTAGAQLTRLGLGDEVAVAWTFARGDDGSVYIGTGNEGKIYRLKGESLEVFAETEQLLVSSLVFGDDGTLYAGTLPEARIFAVDPQGEVEELARPEEAEHVWDLAWDPKRKTLFAATGPEGKVYAVDRQGRVELYFDSEAGHIMSLALDSDGTLYAGTSGEALVMRLRGPGRAEVVHDFPGNEITAVAVRDGTLAVAANEFPDPPRVSSSKKSSAKRPKPGKGQLWRVGTDDDAEKLYARDEGHFTSVQIADDGTIYAGVGKDGHILRVQPSRRSATWIDVDERQVLDLDMVGPDPVFVTGDGAAVYRVQAGKPSEALWTSKVLDAKFRARWGRLTWRASGTLELQTRSGNTEEPDDTWSDWSAPMRSPGPIRSTAGRFLQIRARFSRDPDAVMRAVRAFYLPQNQRPVITEVKLKADDEGEGDAPPDPSTQYELTWDVDNPDDDELRYRLRFRAEGQSTWRSILREDEELTDDEYKWETNAVPDGWYVVQVEASDENANPESLTRKHTAESEPFLVDNHAPQIAGLQQAGRALRGRAVDSVGPIAKLEYAVDGGEWRMFFPTDALLDSATEQFSLDLSGVEAGEHIVAVKATDAGGNTVTAETTVRLR